MSGEHSHRGFMFYFGIFVFLGVITFIELGPLFEWYDLPASLLIVLSIVKFFVVVAFFMHLWDDESIYTRVFAAPLFGSILMVMVLMALFSTFDPSPYDDNYAVAERQWHRFNGECYSWVRSSVSNKMYCASGCSAADLKADGTCSPSVDKDRIAMHAEKKDDAGAALQIPDDPEEAKLALMEAGEELYAANCSACHQANGEGVSGAFPPLAGSDYEGYVQPEGHIKIVLQGLNGEIVVKGQTYNGAMAAFGSLSDAQVAAIITYERNSWGNNDGVVMPDDVAAQR